MTKNKYEESGVSISAGNNFVKQILNYSEKTYSSDVLEGVGGFCSLYRVPNTPSSIIVSSADGVGSKALLAQYLNDFGHLQTIGIDLVAMVMNDIITCGASPLFMLDYYACGNLKQDEKNRFDHSTQIIKGIVDGCIRAGVSLIGGETSEMPDLYSYKQFDLAGFGIGIINEFDLLGKHCVQNDDVIIGIASSGPHSNGFSLIRSVYKKFDWDYDTNHTRLRLMESTTIYVRLIQDLLSHWGNGIHAMAHITGGGLEHNTKRVIPDHLDIEIDWSSWPRPSIFTEIQQLGNIEEQELREVLNCGIGYTIIADDSKADKLIQYIQASEHKCWKIGKVKVK